MPKYFKQKDNSSCGPIAILNLLRWIGINIPYKELKTIRILCLSDKDGTANNILDVVLRIIVPEIVRNSIPTHQNISVKGIYGRPIEKYRKIKKYILLDRAIILSYWEKHKDSGHTILIVKSIKRSNFPVIINMYRTENTEISWCRLKYLIANKAKSFEAWSISCK